MHNLAKLLPPPQKKGGMFDHADWSVRNKEFAEDEIFIAIKDGFHILNLIQIKCKVWWIWYDLPLLLKHEL